MSTMDGEEGMSLLDALVHVMGKMGVAELAGMQRASVARIIASEITAKTGDSRQATCTVLTENENRC